MVTLGYVLAVLVGISLGLIGSGGSILTVPILVYIMGVDPVLATAYSLFIVGATALIGGIQSAREGTVDFKTALIFGIPSIIAVYATRAFLVPIIPEYVFTLFGFEVTKPILLMVLFAVVMVAASITMIRPQKNNKIGEEYQISLNGELCSDSKELITYVKISIALLNPDISIPKDKVNLMKKKIKDYFGIKRLDWRRLEKISKIKTVVIKKTHGEVVMSKVDNIQSFIEMWRTHFLEHNDCKHLPKDWSVKTDIRITHE